MWGRYHLVELNNGYTMPPIGLGTWLSKAEDVWKAIDEALKAGYRHFDTAYVYLNESDIGLALRPWLQNGSIKREEIYITTKLPPTGLHVGKVNHFCELSLKNLGLSYIDLYLIHFPVALQYVSDTVLVPLSEDGSVTVGTESSLEEIWKEMEDLVLDGRVKSIGLSNFNEKQIERIMQCAKIQPAVLQIELHAYMQQQGLRTFCKNNGIALQSYSSFGNHFLKASSPGRPEYYVSNKENLYLLEDETVKEIAERCNKTPGQVLLRYLYQLEIVIIPKSVTPERIRENIDIFDFFLTPKEMAALKKLDREKEGRTFDFSVFGPTCLTHPEYPFIEY